MIDQSAAALTEQLAQFDAAIVSDCLTGNEHAMTANIKPLDRRFKLCGPALTVKCHPGDNLMLHLAVASAKPGDVLVATTNQHYEAGYWGEILTIAAMERNIKGLVIDGSVRDIEQIIDLGFPVFTHSVSIKKAEKKNTGRLNAPIVAGGTIVHPGDIILADASGVAVVPSNRLEEIVRAAQEKVEFEKTVIEQLKQGKLTADLFDLRKYEI
ncbi:RraA family protein [Paenibacillus naphthalenovorans]|uniref:Putative 4-hydroxy-4-methyl-2-oxoglutarate aldolase n=1 Tax=Paenibacillus naphthalenovorans TaxID=162209 RepID=A0A0U2W909_9BACL|nr:RraA family protein [Paenibacillus naphthalenovorans]ALS22942.1 4-hydroxy-4-methyl-2-oxoglutarate aldolase [Paenibacillus naphthalenovorans]